jgi:hypothetical protein
MRVALFLSLAYLALTAALIGLATGCTSRNHAQQCLNIQDCQGDGICFLGTCQPKGFSIQTVFADLTPPSPNLPQQTDSALDLSVGYQTISLLPTLSFSGSVQAQGGAPAGTLVARRQISVPGHPIVQRTAIDTSGAFQLQVIPGGYDLSFVPDDANGAGALPPVRLGSASLLTGGNLSPLHYPDPGTLVVVSGRVCYATGCAAPIVGAVMSAVAETAVGDHLASSGDVTDDTGSYTLVFPPGARIFDVTVRPDGNPYIPDSTATVQLVDGSTTQLEDIVIGTPAFDVSTAVVSASGPVPNAKVYFEGSHVGPLNGTFDTSLVAGVDGTATGKLLPGDYVITVVPSRSDPWAVLSLQAHLEPGSVTPLDSLLVGAKVHVHGSVTAHDGAAVPAANVVFSLGGTPTPRQYTVTTDVAGGYTLDVDPGEYEVRVEPAQDAPLPRQRLIQLVAGSDQTLDIELYRPTFVFGVVRDSGGAAVPNVLIKFYSLELSTDGSPLLVGLDYTGPQGEFAVPLPIPDAR